METTIKTFSRLFGLFLIFFIISDVQARQTEQRIFQSTMNQSRSYYNDHNLEKVLDCLTINIYKEAGYESFEGKIAVAQVVLNRVDHPNFPKDVCSVIYEKRKVSKMTVCQFSWYCARDAHKRPNAEKYNECYEVATKVLLEGYRIDILNDALYFHSTRINPRWRLQRVARIGNHVFYRHNT